MSKKKTSKKRITLTLTDQERLLGWTYLAFQLLVLPSVLGLLGAQFGGFSDSLTNFLYYLINGICCALIFRQAFRSSLIHAGQRIGVLLAVVLIGFPALLGANRLLTLAADSLIPGFVNSNNEAVAAMVRENPVLMTIGTVLLVPIAEECLFRGLLFAGMYRRSRPAAYVLSVLSFSLIHLLSYFGHTEPLALAICFVQYIPAGIILALSLDLTGSLFAPILIHAAVNLGSVLFLR